ncbi:hypothetical protein AB0F91_17440 [Amycolatopsis sp. NPDC023774]|uniref:hypothetical protein n=1 Tax=Amycolatopsis sp. NPDC023774 TaxID=3155015 RepID=UPI0033F6ACA2
MEAKSDDDGSMEFVVLTAWECASCEVAGRTPPGMALECWSCGGSVVITARPSIRRLAG